VEETVNRLKKSFKDWSGEPCTGISLLPASGSERTYWRMTGPSKNAIGVFHPIKEENRAFVEFTDHFIRLGLNVPEIYFYDGENTIYLIQDLGDTSLYSLLIERSGQEVGTELVSFLEKALEELVKFQVLGGKELNYAVCYPHQYFDRQSITWDLNYFKYNFLKLSAPFNEQSLEDDFNRLADFLLEARADYFMYRDFQSRNIMLHDNKLYFIDYQGGRKGPLQYDPISLLYQVKARLSPETRQKLLSFYLHKLSEQIPVDREEFLRYYDGFILLRLLQVLGAYGFRGLIQKKAHFISSIPYAMQNITWFLDNNSLPVELPELLRVLQEVSRQERYNQLTGDPGDRLTVYITSFSYKNGLPEDFSGHGGGFVFDCRALPNPGREENLRMYNGRDPVIIDYLRQKSEVTGFLENVSKIIAQSVEEYMDRGFDRLSVNFGCTGGQHRSVYCSEWMASHIRNSYPLVNVVLDHRELNKAI
jgi:aminoglycoside/choline kinase family phosphotransferase